MDVDIACRRTGDTTTLRFLSFILKNDPLGHKMLRMSLSLTEATSPSRVLPKRVNIVGNVGENKTGPGRHRGHAYCTGRICPTDTTLEGSRDIQSSTYFLPFPARALKCRRVWLLNQLETIDLSLSLSLSLSLTVSKPCNNSASPKSSVMLRSRRCHAHVRSGSATSSNAALRNETFDS